MLKIIMVITCGYMETESARSSWWRLNQVHIICKIYVWVVYSDFSNTGIVWMELGCVRLTVTKVSQTSFIEGPDIEVEIPLSVEFS